MTHFATHSFDATHTLLIHLWEAQHKRNGIRGDSEFHLFEEETVSSRLSEEETVSSRLFEEETVSSRLFEEETVSSHLFVRKRL
jgi:hypothetical protein